MRNRRLRFVHALVGWMLAALVVLATLDALRYELFVVVSLVGLLVVLELTAPVAATPRWRARLRWLVAAGLFVFAVVVVRRVLALLPDGLLEAALPGVVP